MARNETFIDAPPEAVFELLADPRTYAHWVVGTREIRAVDKGWPARGTTLNHTIGIPPLLIKDRTVVLDADPPVTLELHAGAHPLPSARVSFHLDAVDGGTQVTMIETLANPVLNLGSGPLTHFLIHLRNREALRRLKTLAEV